MLKWALIFFAISIVAGLLGFSGISAATAGIARSCSTYRGHIPRVSHSRHHGGRRSHLMPLLSAPRIDNNLETYQWLEHCHHCRVRHRNRCCLR
jgi:hypothetical protein